MSSSKSHTPRWVNWYNEDELSGKYDDDDDADKDKETVIRFCVFFSFSANSNRVVICWLFCFCVMKYCLHLTILNFLIAIR